MSGVSAPTDSRPRPDAVPASPPARRHHRAVWRDPRLVTGVVIVAACGLLGGTLLGGSDRTAAVWTAARPLSAGQPLTAGDLVRREVGFDDPSAAHRYLSGDRPAPDGAVLARPVGEGELVPAAALRAGEPAPVTEVPLSVLPDALPGTVRLGSVVDVWVVPDRTAVPSGGRPDDAELVFDDVSVLSLGRSGSSLGPASTRQVIVGVGAGQRTRLPHALTALGGGAVVLTRQR
jgi:hypothetical protein